MEPQTKLIDPFVAFLNSILPQKKPDKPGDRQEVHHCYERFVVKRFVREKYGDSIPIHQSGPSIAELTGSPSFGIDLEQNLDKLRGDVKVGSL